MLMNYVFILNFVFLKVSSTQNQQWLNKSVWFTHTIVLLIYVNETIYLLRNQPFFKIHGNRFIAQDDLSCASSV